MYQTERYAQIEDKTIDDLAVSSSKCTQIDFLVKILQNLQKKYFWAKKCISCQIIHVKSNFLVSTSKRYLKNGQKHRLEWENFSKTSGFMFILMHCLRIFIFVKILIFCVFLPIYLFKCPSWGSRGYNLFIQTYFRSALAQ